MAGHESLSAGSLAELYKYSEDASPGMNEGICVNMVNTAFAYGLLLPPAKSKE